jgi:hypothetical protein
VKNNTTAYSTVSFGLILIFISIIISTSSAFTSGTIPKPNSNLNSNLNQNAFTTSILQQVSIDPDKNNNNNNYNNYNYNYNYDKNLEFLNSDSIYQSINNKINNSNQNEIKVFFEEGLLNNKTKIINFGSHFENVNNFGYSEGNGIFNTIDRKDIVQWKAFDRGIPSSDNTIKYAGIIFFKTDKDNSAANQLSFLDGKMGIYEYRLYENGDNATASERFIWIWPNN